MAISTHAQKEADMAKLYKWKINSVQTEHDSDQRISSKVKPLLTIYHKEIAVMSCAT